MAAKRIEVVSFGRPRKVISGKHEFIAIEQNCVSASMTRHRNYYQIIGEINGIVSFRLNLYRLCRAANIRTMQHTVASEMFVKLRVIGYVVAMGEKHQLDATH